MNDLEYLGREVKVAREGRKLTQSQLGKATGYSESYVSKVEAGTIIPSEKFAMGCDLALGTNGAIERLRERLVKRGHPSWFAPFAKLEQKAVEIFDYSVWTLPGLLQTPDYARAMFRAGAPEQPEERVEERTEARMTRKEILTNETPPAFWAVIQESALHSHIGGSGGMRDQLLHLTEMAQMPNVAIQVLPYEAGAPAATEPFIRLRLRDGREIVYSDTAMGGQMSEAPDPVAFAARAADLLRADALSPKASIRLLKKIAKGIHSDDED
ncbi:helix-turn-helix domain-containing protein [Streptomyces sedi]|uniref:helix-turn-helix domain-containing protein n=1 Tax=Streptomyces sedi TaxID=555059 RepID=UPI0014770B06|nr:helix-turn-helix transcriptional regulator [Streptomyces sedi]